MKSNFLLAPCDKYGVPELHDYRHIFFGSKKEQGYCTALTVDIFELIYKSDVKAVKDQINKGIIRVNFRNDNGQTLLHYALLYNQIEIAEFLISKNADLDAKDKAGQTIKSVLQERYPDIYNKLDEYISDCFLAKSEEQQLVEESQIKVVGESSNCDWCIIL